MTIDWEEIWKTHSPYYKEGKFELTLVNGEKVLFHPGPAFGDGSHPTTNLVLKHLPSLVANKKVVDLGSGSGILSMAAAKLGASTVHALEIDPLATETMEKNLLLNDLPKIKINIKPQSFDTVLLNMISSEQTTALASHPYLLKKGTSFLISGILEEEVQEVLASFGQPLVHLIDTCGEWAFLHLTVNNSY